ncbi:MAG: hypothetical protein A2X86_04905 [Bdellovibrionales bacterium GWA2_49_15]|nr:MAG: hypothetical protein A2X86_04905 [Bdellovibrionales bacterium GWA2_49_15]
MSFSLPKSDSNFWSYLALIFIFFLFLFHIGDQSAPRQGTEGFYLQISKEMFSRNSYLIPYYLNEPHFSKPPLQFWLTSPFYFIFGEGLWTARISIFIITCFLIACVSKLLSRLGPLSPLSIFILFISTFGVIKYSRIYMMDAFFTFFTGAGTLFAFEYIKSKHVHSLVFSAFLLAASSLIKGPISIVMALSAVFIFVLIKRERALYRYFFQLSILVLILASFWYIACFYQYGSKFFDYFFMRENLGKFTAQTYSPIVLLQGLILFSFPVIVPFALQIYRDIKSRTLIKTDLNLFLLICFIIFWTIWLIPSQRSHHYAMPATFFVVSYVAISRFDSLFFAKLINAFSLALTSIGIILVALILFFKQFLPLISTTTCLLALTILTASMLFTLFAKGTMNLRLAQYTVSLILIWYHIAAMVALPILPERAREQLVSTNSNIRIGVVYRKPYFVSDLLGRDIEPLSHGQGTSELLGANFDYLIMPSTETTTSSKFQVLASWTVWKRGLRTAEIYEKLTNNKLDELQESYTLFHRKQQATTGLDSSPPL